MPSRQKKILNPITGKLVNADGKIGRLIKKYIKKRPSVRKRKSPTSKKILKRRSKEPINKQSIKEKPDQKPVILRRRIEIPQELNIIDLKFDVKKIDVNEKENKVKSGITLEKFEELVKNDSDFIDNFRKSLIKLLDYKYSVYSNVSMLPKELKNTVPLPPQQKPPKSVYTILLEQIIKLLKKIYNINFNTTLKESLLDAINNKKFGMKTLIGREDIMNRLCSILYAFSKNYKLLTNTFINFALFGSAGVGKSALAKVIAYSFKNSFILVKGDVIMGTRQDLVGKYIGETAIKTRKLLFDGLEGIVFIDEAYSLTPCSKDDTKDFGSEAIAELINFMDKTIGLMVVMVAGYKDKMQNCFFPSNEGLDRRFPNKFSLRAYTDKELTKILLTNLKNSNIKVDQQTANLLFTLISKLRKHDENIFNNQAGDMLNLSNSIVQNIYMSQDNKWGNYIDNKEIIYQAIDEFLTNKEFFIIFKK